MTIEQTVEPEPFPWDAEPSPPHTEATVELRVLSATPLITYVIRAEQPEWVGELGAKLYFDREYGPISLSFAVGYDEPLVVLAAIDNLRTALDDLRERVVRASGGGE